mmetsp:Transcript_15476/g.23608  ORF Transcript_15476/g.23608 Transcript_15476/m.23608 type:complete len:298 (-) Transcript_15476:243-1136(-)
MHFSLDRLHCIANQRHPITQTFHLKQQLMLLLARQLGKLSHTLIQRDGGNRTIRIRCRIFVRVFLAQSTWSFASSSIRRYIQIWIGRRMCTVRRRLTTRHGWRLQSTIIVIVIAVVRRACSAHFDLGLQFLWSFVYNFTTRFSFMIIVVKMHFFFIATATRTLFLLLLLLLLFFFNSFFSARLIRVAAFSFRTVLGVTIATTAWATLGTLLTRIVFIIITGSILHGCLRLFLIFVIVVSSGYSNQCRAIHILTVAVVFAATFCAILMLTFAPLFLLLFVFVFPAFLRLFIAIVFLVF